MTVRQASRACLGVLLVGVVLIGWGFLLAGRSGDATPYCGRTEMKPGQRCAATNVSQRGTYEEIRLRAADDARAADEGASVLLAGGGFFVVVGGLGWIWVILWARRQDEYE